MNDKRRIKLAIVMDPISKINYKKDSSLAMLWAAKDKDWQLFYLEMPDLYAQNGEAFGLAQPLDVFKDEDNFYQLGEKSEMPLADFDVILMRKDPPFDNEYIYATYILELAENKGSLIVNKPQSLRDNNEKFFATLFPQCTPANMITRSAQKIRDFYAEHQDIILKPLDGMGGASIFRIKANDPNLSVIIETLTKHGTEQIMAQKFIPEIKQGDKRILMIDGEAIPYGLARIPAKGETRGNLAAGGSGLAQPLSEHDLWIANQVGPSLKAKGLIFVGLDVIGDYLTEINVTSPTCIREIDKAYDTNIATKLMDCIEKKIS